MSGIQTVIKWLPTQNLANPWQSGNNRVEFGLRAICKCKFGQASSLLRSHWMFPLLHVSRPLWKWQELVQPNKSLYYQSRNQGSHFSLSITPAATQVSWYSLGWDQEMPSHLFMGVSALAFYNVPGTQGTVFSHGVRVHCFFPISSVFILF